jgi:hypothetical protein
MKRRLVSECADISKLTMRQADLVVSEITKWGYRLQTNSAGQITTSGDSGGPCFWRDGKRQ